MSRYRGAPSRVRPGTRTATAAVFPVPGRRLAVVDIDGVLDRRPVVRAMAEDLDWGLLIVSDAAELTWTLRINRPAAALLVAADSPPRLERIEQVQRAIRGPVALLADLDGPETVSAIRAGADTVIPSTVDKDELGARLLALVRRTWDGAHAGVRYLVSGPLRVDLWQHEVTLDHDTVSLTATEFGLLVALMEAAGKVVPITRIVSRVWGWAGVEDGANAVRLTIGRLRRKLGDDARHTRFVGSVRGVGYRFVAQVTELGQREDASTEVGDDLQLAQRLARRCEELSLEPAAEAAADLVTRALVEEGTVDAASVHLLEDDRLQLIAHHGYTEAWGDAVRELRVADTRYAAVCTLQSQEPLHLQRRASLRYPGLVEVARTELPGAYVFVPLRSGDSAIGTLGVHRHSGEPFGPLTVTYLSAVGALLGVCLSARRGSARWPAAGQPST